jgi:hypothetical protein
LTAAACNASAMPERLLRSKFVRYLAIFAMSVAPVFVSAMTQLRIGDVEFSIPPQIALHVLKTSKAFEISGLRKTRELKIKDTAIKPPLLRTLQVTEVPQQAAIERIEYLRSRILDGSTKLGVAPDGFWEWKGTNEFVYTGKSARSLNQPLVISCTESNFDAGDFCSSHFYLTHQVSVRYEFYVSDVPRQNWVENDRIVLELLKALRAN